VECGAGLWSESERAFGSSGRRKRRRAGADDVKSAYPYNLVKLLLRMNDNDEEATNDPILSIQEACGARSMYIGGTFAHDTDRLHFFLEVNESNVAKVVPALEELLSKAHATMSEYILDPEKVPADAVATVRARGSDDDGRGWENEAEDDWEAEEAARKALAEAAQRIRAKKARAKSGVLEPWNTEIGSGYLNGGTWPWHPPPRPLAPPPPPPPEDAPGEGGADDDDTAAPERKRPRTK